MSNGCGLLSPRAAGRLAAAACLVIATSLSAQERSGTVLLQLRPHVGDTLRTRLEQQTEVQMTTSSSAGVAGTTRSSMMSATIASRTIVRAVAGTSTTVLTLVDSAVFTSSDARAAAMFAGAQRSLEGQQLVLRLSWDGSVESAHDARTGRVSRDVADAMATMPAVFPGKPVQVGEQWAREMPLPAGGPLGARASGRVKAVFRLDSLRGKRLAFVSMRGEIVPDVTPAGAEMRGTITGMMLLDRDRGWMTDSRIVVLIRSALGATMAAGSSPTRFVTRVTQRLRTMDK